MSGPAHLGRGRWAEDAAVTYLEQQGLVLEERNFRSRLGEIDLVMSHDGVLVFVEVRYRRGDAYGSALESVDRRKQGKLIAAARVYLAARACGQAPCRFDVLSVTQRNYVPEFHWVQDAFGQNG